MGEGSSSHLKSLNLRLGCSYNLLLGHTWEVEHQCVTTAISPMKEDVSKPHAHAIGLAK